MSEKPDKQQNPNTKRRDLLKKLEVLGQVSFPKLNKVGWQSLTVYLTNLDAEKTFEKCRLSTSPCSAENQCFESGWESRLRISEEPNEKPDELKRCEDKLKKQSFNDSKAEGHHTERNLIVAQNFVTAVRAQRRSVRIFARTFALQRQHTAMV